LQPANVENLKNILNTHLDNNFYDFNFKKNLRVLSEIDLSLVNYELLELLSKLEPFGNGNEEPLFCIRNLTIKEIRYLGEKKNHLSLVLSSGVLEIKGMFFSFEKDSYEVFLGLKIDIVGKIRKNEYRGKTTIDLNIVDLKKSDA